MSLTPRAVAPYPLVYEGLLRRALAEDLEQAGDLTTDAIVPPATSIAAALLTREDGRLCGLEMGAAAFRLLDPEVTVTARHQDGDDLDAGAIVAIVRGNGRAILTAERTALNLMARLSGIATATRAVVASVRDTPAVVVCTRKTTPGLRALEKYAVRCGGGRNHRFGLGDGVLIKDNHRRIAGSVGEAVRRVRRAVGHMVKVEVEVDTLEQLEEALSVGVELVLLDNMGPPVLRQAVAMARGRCLTEASGGVTPETAREIAATGVDLISMGWLTHSAPSLDLTLELQP